MRETKRGTIEDRSVDSALGLRTKYGDQRSHDVCVDDGRRAQRTSRFCRMRALDRRKSKRVP